MSVAWNECLLAAGVNSYRKYDLYPTTHKKHTLTAMHTWAWKVCQVHSDHSGSNTIIQSCAKENTMTGFCALTFSFSLSLMSPHGMKWPFWTACLLVWRAFPVRLPGTAAVGPRTHGLTVESCVCVCTTFVRSALSVNNWYVPFLVLKLTQH